VLLNAITDPSTSYKYAKTSFNSGKIIVVNIYHVGKALYIGITSNNHTVNNSVNRTE
jgi:hypothetical protein